MRTISRFEPFRGISPVQDQLNRMFDRAFERVGEESSLSAWAPAVDIYETEHELVVKADLPEIDPKDLDIRVEHDVADFIVNQAGWQRTTIFAAPYLVQDPAAQSGLEDMEFGLAHCPASAV